MNKKKRIVASFFVILKVVNNMNVVEIINKKRRKEILTDEEIAFMVKNYVDGMIPDYQMSSFLMTICMAGMKQSEIFSLTDCMIKSGEVLDFSCLGENVVDKHSTGGVGDKTTLVLAPIVASLGVDVAKMSGRGLGFTGGTIDKLESMNGFRTSLTKEEFIEQVKDIHLAICSGTSSLVPADKKIYALRDVTGTVESIPLIASSIMSKKIAAGTKKIVIDVKVGKGALMKNESDARKLARTMIAIGKNYGVKVVCVLTRMDAPLGYSIGNGIEVKETVNFLKGQYASDLYELVITLGSYMVSLGKNVSFEKAKEMVEKAIAEKKGYPYFLKMAERQQGDLRHVFISSRVIEIESEKSGYVHDIDAYKLANLSQALGSGRQDLNDKIDLGVGIWIHKKPGDFVKKGESLVSIYQGKKAINFKDVEACFTIKRGKVEKQSIIIDVIK